MVSGEHTWRESSEGTGELAPIGRGGKRKKLRRLTCGSRSKAT